MLPQGWVTAVVLATVAETALWEKLAAQELLVLQVVLTAVLLARVETLCAVREESRPEKKLEYRCCCCRHHAATAARAPAEAPPSATGSAERPHEPLSFCISVCVPKPPCK